MPVEEGDHVLGTRADTSSSAERWPTVSSKRVEAIIEVSWPTVRALAIGAATSGRPRSQASATAAGVVPCSRAMSSRTPTTVSPASL
jgi:hypothetical protein